MSAVEKLVKLSAQTAPRDRLCRFVQYGSKVLWYYGGPERQACFSKDTADRIKALEANLSMGRRMLRLGRTLPVLHSALQSLHFPDAVRRITITLSRIASSLYLLVDNIVWLARVGMLRIDTKAWVRLSSRFWLLSLLCNLIRDLYELLLIFEAVDRRQSPDASPTDRAKAVGSHLMRQERPLLLDVCSNLGDLLLPMSTLTYVNITPGLEGLLGLCSSATRLVALWNPALKMVP